MGAKRERLLEGGQTLANFLVPGRAKIGEVVLRQ